MDDDLERHMDILAEAADRKIERILEGLSLLDEKVDRDQAESRQEFAETRSMIKLSYASVLFSEDRQ